MDVYPEGVRGRVAITFLIVALALAAPAAASASSIRGVVLDTTCYGPCVYPQLGASPYEGGGLSVRVHRVRTGHLVGVAHPEDGRFRFHVRRGRYRVRAEVQGRCWEGETKDVKVPRREIERVRLHVQNVCVV